MNNCPVCEVPLKKGTFCLYKKGYITFDNINGRFCEKCYGNYNYCYFCNNPSSSKCSYCFKDYCEECEKCLDCDKCKYNLNNIDCNNRNTLDNCISCKGQLTLGQHINYTKEKGYYLTENLNKDSKCCVKCKKDYCYFCNNFSDNDCMSCDIHYCEKCAEKWEEETRLSFMYGDLTACVLCAFRNRDYYLK